MEKTLREADYCTCDNVKCPRHGDCRACVCDLSQGRKAQPARCLKYMLEATGQS